MSVEKLSQEGERLQISAFDNKLDPQETIDFSHYTKYMINTDHPSELFKSAKLNRLEIRSL